MCICLPHLALRIDASAMPSVMQLSCHHRSFGWPKSELNMCTTYQNLLGSNKLKSFNAIKTSLHFFSSLKFQPYKNSFQGGCTPRAHYIKLYYTIQLTESFFITKLSKSVVSSHSKTSTEFLSSKPASLNNV